MPSEMPALRYIRQSSSRVYVRMKGEAHVLGALALTLGAVDGLPGQEPSVLYYSPVWKSYKGTQIKSTYYSK